MSLARRGKHHRRSGPHPHGHATPVEPLFVFSRDAIRELDRLAADELRIPSILLMEHASLALARHASDMAPDAGVLIVCGVGNNAGDGLALARHLHLAGRDVHVVLARSDGSLSGDAGANLQIARRLGVPISRAAEADPAAAFHAAVESLQDVALIVDALLGTGLSGSPRGAVRTLIHAVNAAREQGIPVLSVDIPSGLEADAGTPAGRDDDVVVADRTVTFVGLKRGFLSVDAQRFIGDVVVEPIGTPLDLSDRLAERLCLTEHPGDGVETDPAPTAGPHAARRPGAPDDDDPAPPNDRRRRSRHRAG